MQAKIVTNGACLRCSFGSSENRLKIKEKAVKIEGEAVATIDDGMPFVNIEPFGICSATQKPCVPVTSVWSHSKESLSMDSMQVISDESHLICQVGGIITVESIQQTVDC